MLRLFPLLFLLVLNSGFSVQAIKPQLVIPIQPKDETASSEKQDAPKVEKNMNIAYMNMDTPGKFNQTNTSVNITKLDHSKGKDSQVPQKTLIDTSSKTETENSIVKSSVQSDPEPQVESGAVIRGVCVMVGLSFLFILYLGIKNYSKKNSKTAIVKKYGVRTRRNDVEMEPLPLSDDEDETVFDLGRLNNKQ